jgi:hypothetical protein
VGSHRREAPSPQSPSSGSEVHWTTLGRPEVRLKVTSQPQANKGPGLCSTRISWRIPPLLSRKERREGHEKRWGTSNRPLAMGRGSGATLTLRPRPRSHTPRTVKDLGSISYPSKASGATLGGCARVHPLEKSNTKASRGPSDDPTKSPAKSRLDRQPLEE